MSNFSFMHWLIVLVILGVPILLIALVVGVLKPQPNEVARTWKFRTVVYLFFALLTSFLVVTIPIFLYLAYRSYQNGSTGAVPQPANVSPPSNLEELERLHALVKSGALTQEEYETEKRKVLTK